MTINEIFSTNRSPLSNLVPIKSTRVKGELMSLSANTATTLATLTGTGTISTIWMTMNANNLAARLQIFVDGEIVPSIDVDVATLFLANWASLSNFMWSVQHMHGEGGAYSSQGGYIKFPIPYSNGAVVKLITISAITQFYYMVDAQPGLYMPYRLKSINRSITNNKLTFATGDSLDLFTTPTSPGWLVYVGYVGVASNLTGESYLERNFALYIDDEGSPSHLSSGTEDFFFGSYYWQGQQSYSSPSAALSYKVSGRVATCVDLLELCNGIYFGSEMRCHLPTEGVVNIGHDCGFVAFFYTPDDSSWATPVTVATTPQAPTNIVATAGDAAATIEFYPTINDGGAAVTQYRVISTPGSLTQTGTTSPITVTGLTNNTAYTFTVRATNSEGNSSESVASNSVTPVSAGTIVIEDQFTGADTTNGLPSHTPDTVPGGSSWAVTGSGVSYGISSNKAYISASGDGVESFAIIDSGTADATCSADITLTATADRTLRGLVFRYADASNYMKAVIVKLGGGLNQLELTKVVSGGQTNLATYSSAGFSESGTYNIKVVYTGNTFNVYVDNVVRISHTDSNSLSSNTKNGLFTYHQTGNYDNLGGRWDNFKVID